MASKIYYQVMSGGKPQRFVSVPKGAWRALPAGAGLDGPTEFAKGADAAKRASRAGLDNYSIVPVARDCGSPTHLTEVGF